MLSVQGPEVAVLEACQYAPRYIQKQALTSSLLPLSCIAGTQEHFSTVKEQNLGTHSTMKSSSKPGLPSQRMLPACSSLVTGMTTPPLSTSKSVHLPQPVPVDKVSEQSHKSHGRSSYNCYREGTANNVAASLTGVYSNSDPSEAAVVATLAYARMQSEQGFPYGISGVAMPSYNYGSELYNYASNGFPRKSRICGYCSKVFTRSTTRRYHEKRCPVRKAKGSLAKGSSDTSVTSIVTTAGTGSSGDDGISSSGSLNIPSHPPPLLTMNRESPSPLLISTSSAVSTSLGMSVLSNAHKLNSIYSAYGSQSMYSNVPVTSTSSARNSSPSSVAGSSSNVDQNRNSVLSSIKQEPGSLVNFQVAGASPDFSVACSLSRDLDSVNSKALTKAEYGQHLFSTLSTASLSPSNGSHSVEDDVESDAAEDLTVKPTKSANNSSLAVGNGSHRGSNPTSGKSFFLNNYTYNNSSQPLSQESYKLFWGSQVTQMSPLELAQKSADIRFDEDGNSFMEGKGDARNDCNIDPRGRDYGASNMDVDKAYSSIPEKECGICKQQFDSSRALHSHMQVHQKYSPNSCHICGQRFLRTSMRMAHERIHNVENPFCCVVCGVFFARKFALRQHVIRQHVRTHNHMPVACRHCKKTASSLIHLHQHVLTHNILQQERTSLLYLRFAKSRSSSPLKEEVAPKLPPPLSVDSRASDDSPAMLSEPPPLIQMRPSPTSIAGSEESILTNGHNTPSGARDKEWCRLCDKEYPKSFMRFHEKAHADQKPYECPTCKKRFGYKNNMKSHIKLHAGIKPYHCHICGARFTRGSTLRRHARRHGGNTETIWDMFVSNGKSTQQSPLANRGAVPNQAHEAANIALPSPQGQVPTASLVMPGEALRTVTPRSRTLKPESSGVSIGGRDALPSGNSFDVRGFSSSPSLPQNLFASYQGLPAVTQSLYPPYMATAQFLNYASGLSAASSVQQDIQSDALNLSLPDKQRRSTSSLGTSSQDQIPSAVGHSQGPVYHPTVAADGASSSCHDLISDDENMDGKVSTMMEKSMPRDHGHEEDHQHGDEGSSPSMSRSQVTPMVQDSQSIVKPLCSSNAKDYGAQVTLCCSRIVPVGNNADTLEGDCSENAPLDMSASSPSRIGSSALEGLQHETIAMLMTAGKLFRCPYCDCYFTDYTMYHVHQKLHQPDQPFTCNTCGENCRDKVYFSLHIYDHLR